MMQKIKRLHNLLPILLILLAAVVFLAAFIAMPTSNTANAVSGYYVYYNGNGYTGGTVPSDPALHGTGTLVTVLGTGDMVKAGYTFLNWNTASNGTGTTYLPSSTFNITNNITLYAQWEISVWDGTPSLYFASGAGTELDPYMIETAGQLLLMSNIINGGINATVISGGSVEIYTYLQTAYYELGADISLNNETFTFDADTGLIMMTDGTNTAYLGTGIKGDNSGSNTQFDSSAASIGSSKILNVDTYEAGNYLGTVIPWIPIGNYSDAFSGYFDGNGYKISNIYINDYDNYQGLFGCVNYAQIEGIILESGYIYGYYFIGGIAGITEDSSVINCVNSATIVSEYYYIGGIVGLINTSNIQNCTNEGIVVSSPGNVGGIVGNCESTSTITQCNNSGSIYSYDYSAGGIVGSAGNLEVINCYNEGDIFSTNGLAGGIAGSGYNTNIISCYNIGSISGDSKLGGIAGTIGGYAIVSDCYNIGNVTGADYIGSIMGQNYIEEFLLEDSICNYYLAGCAIDGNLTVQNGEGNETEGSSTEDISGMCAAFTDADTAFDHDGDPETDNLSLTDALNIVVNNEFIFTIFYSDYKMKGWESSIGCYPEFVEITRYYVVMNDGIYDDIYTAGYVDIDEVLYKNPMGDELYEYSTPDYIYDDSYTCNGIFTEAEDGILIIDENGIKISIAGYTDATGNWIISDNVVLYYQWTLADPVIDEISGYEDEDYDGSEHYIEVDADHGLSEDYDLEYQWYKGSVLEENKIIDATDYDLIVINVSDNGTYYCVVSISDGTQSASVTSDAIIVSINKQELSEPTITGTYTYDGTEQLVDYSSGYDTETMSVIGEEAGTDADDYTLTFTLLDEDNYEWADEEDGEVIWTIGQATNIWVSEVSLTGWTYGETANDPSATATFGTPTYSYSNSEDGTYYEYMSINGGTWWVKATVVGTTNYTGIVSTSSYTVLKADIAVPEIVGTYTYNGEAQTAQFTAYNIDNIMRSSSNVKTNAGVYTISFMLLHSLDYQWADDGDGTVSWTIEKAELAEPTITGTYTYDGTVKLVDYSSGYNASKMSVSGDEEGTDADDYTLTFTLLDEDNYKWADEEDGEVIWTIGQATNIWVSEVSLTGWTYGETANDPTATATFGTPTYSYSNSEDGTYYEYMSINGGTWWVKATVVGTTNYTGIVSTSSYTVLKADIAVPEIVGTYTYNGEAQTAQFTAYNIDNIMRSSSNVKTNAGVYTISFMLLHSLDYQWADDGDGTVSWTIEKAELAEPTITGTYIYDGSLQMSTYSGYNDLTMSLGGDTLGENAGDYTLTFTLLDTDNYEWAEGSDGEVDWTIGQATNEWANAVSLTGWTYGDTPNDPTATATFGTPTYSYAYSELGIYSGTKISNGGTFWVKATVVGTTNYTGIVSTSSYTILKADMAVPELVGTYTYNGEAQTAQFTAYNNNKILPSGATKTDAGTYTISFMLLYPLDYQWAEGSDGTVSWTIEKAELAEPTVSGTYTYDSTEQTVSLTGFDSAKMSISGNIQTNADTYTISITLGSNYKWAGGSDGEINWTIAPLALTVTALNKSIVEGASNVDLTYTSDGLIGEDSFTGALTRESGDSAGEYAINQGTLSAGSNYSITYIGATYTIRKVQLETTDDEEDDTITATINTPDGIDPNAELVLRTISNSDNELLLAPNGMAISNMYNVQLYLNDSAIDQDGEMTVSFAAPSTLANATECQIIIFENGQLVTKTANIQNGYITFTTSSLGDFAIVSNTPDETSSMNAGTIIGIIMSTAFLAIAAYMIILLSKRKKQGA